MIKFRKAVLLFVILAANLFGTVTVTEQEMRDNIIVTAAQMLGAPYKSGGKSPTGFDCSGFVNYVMNSQGVSVARSSAGIINDGIQVLLDAVKPGDILIFKGTNKKSNRAGHSAIVHHVDEEGTIHFIHSASSKGITIDDMNQSYYKSRFIEARDVVSLAIQD